MEKNARQTASGCQKTEVARKTGDKEAEAAKGGLSDLSKIELCDHGRRNRKSAGLT